MRAEKKRRRRDNVTGSCVGDHCRVNDEHPRALRGPLEQKCVRASQSCCFGVPPQRRWRPPRWQEQYPPRPDRWQATTGKPLYPCPLPSPTPILSIPGPPRTPPPPSPQRTRCPQRTHTAGSYTQKVGGERVMWKGFKVGYLKAEGVLCVRKRDEVHRGSPNSLRRRRRRDYHRHRRHRRTPCARDPAGGDMRRGGPPCPPPPPRPPPPPPPPSPLLRGTPSPPTPSADLCCDQPAPPRVATAIAWSMAHVGSGALSGANQLCSSLRHCGGLLANAAVASAGVPTAAGTDAGSSGAGRDAGQRERPLQDRSLVRVVAAAAAEPPQRPLPPLLRHHLDAFSATAYDAAADAVRLLAADDRSLGCTGLVGEHATGGGAARRRME